MRKTDTGKTETKILFGDEKEITSRKGRLKSLRGYKTDLEYLLDGAHEKSMALTDLMVAEGLSDEFIRSVLCSDTDDAYLMTLDFLHCAALIMGEDYVRENLVGKTVSASDAAREIRECFHEEQLKPYREIYENLDERLLAAKEGETLINHQMEILKIQSEHAKEMYERAAKNAATCFGYEKRLLIEKGRAEKEKNLERIKVLEEDISSLREKLKTLERENKGLRLSPAKCPEDEREDFGEGRFVDFSWRRKRKRKEQDEEEKKERTDFAVSVLGNTAFSAEQITLLLPALENEKVPLFALKKLCVPSLPVENMKAFIRYLEGGKTDEQDK